MSRRARLLLLAGGSALFAYLISRIGLAALVWSAGRHPVVEPASG